MIVLAVTWKATPGREAEVAEIFRKLTAESRKEAGCLMYQVQRQQKDASRFFVYEQYRNQQALEAHRNAPHFLEYARKQLPAVAERVEGELYKVASASGELIERLYKAHYQRWPAKTAQSDSRGKHFGDSP